MRRALLIAVMLAIVPGVAVAASLSTRGAHAAGHAAPTVPLHAALAAEARHAIASDKRLAPARKSAHAPTITVPQDGGSSCYVGTQCSLQPCVYPVAGAGSAVRKAPLAGQAAPRAPVASGQKCTRGRRMPNRGGAGTVGAMQPASVAVAPGAMQPASVAIASG